jgi:hypothetical protein
MPNEPIKKEETGSFKSMMAAQTDYINSIGKGLKDIIGKMTNYQTVCGYKMLSQINILLAKEKLNWLSPEVDRESINNAIMYAVIYSLNPDNKEVFAIVRNEKRGKTTKTNERGQSYEADNWVKVIEVKPQYRGVLKILADYGRNVKKVYPEWIVRQNDPFKYQKFKGTKVEDPEWEPRGTTEPVVRVVVPVEYTDGFIDYRIAELESIATNIKAQIKQSLMSKDDTTKAEIMAKIADMTLEQLFADESLKKYINETYTGISREEMIITKLVLNAVKRIPIDYQSGLARELNEKTFDNADVYKQHHNAQEVLAMANAPMLDVQEVESKPGPKVDDDGVVVKNETKPAPVQDEPDEPAEGYDVADLFGK